MQLSLSRSQTRLDVSDTQDLLNIISYVTTIKHVRSPSLDQLAMFARLTSTSTTTSLNCRAYTRTHSREVCSLLAHGLAGYSAGSTGQFLGRPYRPQFRNTRSGPPPRRKQGRQATE